MTTNVRFPAALASLLLATACVSSVSGQEPGPNEGEWQIRVRVVDADGRLIANAKVGTQSGNSAETAKWHTSDKEGNCTLTVATKLPSYFYLFARADGYAPMRAHWSNRKNRPEDPLPEGFTFEMTKAISVGGFVVDEENNPVRGATVDFSAGDFKTYPGRRAQPSFNSKFITDEAGKWKCDLAPESMSSASMNVTHPDFANESSRHSLDHKLDVLRDHQHIWTLRKGFAVVGKVVDQNGKAVEGAALAIGRLNSWLQIPVQKTDAEGRYRFGNVSPPDPQDGNPQIFENEIAMTVTIVKPGFSPMMELVPGYGKRPLDTSTEKERIVDFQLEPGVRLELKIVDSNNKPIKKASVQPFMWRNTQVLQCLREYGIPTHADDNGVWKWDDAPDGDKLQLFIMNSGFSDTLIEAQIEEGAKPLKIVLKRRQVILGSVVDSVTKKPIKDFVLERAFEGMAGHPGGLSWTSDGIRGKEGKYRGEITMPPYNGSYTYRILADGYDPAISESTPFTEGETKIDFELTPKKDGAVVK